MSLRFLGAVAWLEFPRHKNKSRRRTTLALTDDDGAATVIDWRPWNPYWDHGRLQMAWVEDGHGLREDTDRFWKLVQAYSEEEVEQLLQEGNDGAQTEGGVTDVGELPPAPSQEPLGTATETSAEDSELVGSKRKPREWLAQLDDRSPFRRAQ